MNWTSTRVEQMYYKVAEGSLTEIMVYAIVGGYALTSLLLLRFPYILHRRKHIRFEASKISHRGGWGILVSLILKSSVFHDIVEECHAEKTWHDGDIDDNIANDIDIVNAMLL